MGEGNSKESTSSSLAEQPETNIGVYPSQTTPPKLIDAAIKGQVETVNKLIKKGKKVESINDTFTIFFSTKCKE